MRAPRAERGGGERAVQHRAGRALAKALATQATRATHPATDRVPLAGPDAAVAGAAAAGGAGAESAADALGRAAGGGAAGGGGGVPGGGRAGEQGGGGAEERGGGGAAEREGGGDGHPRHHLYLRPAAPPDRGGVLHRRILRIRV